MILLCFKEDCAGVVCPQIECQTQQYIPLGECCSICAGNFIELKLKIYFISDTFVVGSVYLIETFYLFFFFFSC